MTPAVLLVPGWRDTAAVLHPLRDFLVGSGWPAEHVAVVSFRDPFGDNITHAAELGQALHALMDAAPARPVVIVAHSMGGLATRWYLSRHHEQRVVAALFLATPHKGTWLAWLAAGGGAADMRPHSRFLDALQRSALPEHLRCTCFRAPWDTRLLPRHSAWLEEMDCELLPAAGHKRIVRQRRVMNMLRDRILTYTPSDERMRHDS